MISVTNKHTAVRRAVVVDASERMPEVLASRALELLRATALELSVETSGTATPPQPRPITNGALRSAAIAAESTPFSVDSGFVVFQNPKGVPPSFAPVLRLGFRLASWVELRTSAGGLGTRPRVETPHGSASVSQSFLLFELATRLAERGVVRPRASLGGGLLHVGISGTGVPPYEGRQAERWSASIDGGVGLALPFRSRAAVVAELHCLLASPHPSIRFVDTVPATIGNPSLMLSLALEVMP